jgi:signal peptidase
MIMKMNKTQKSAMIETTILIIIVVVGGYALISGLSVTLETPNPLEWVGSGSMRPVLQAGDLILVQGVEPSKIQVNDVIVFHQPNDYGNLIIHRVVNIKTEDDEIYFTTKGDANPASIWWEENIPASYVVGKWTGFRIPYLGWAIYILKLPVVDGLTLGSTAAITLILILLALGYFMPEEKESPKEKE